MISPPTVSCVESILPISLSENFKIRTTPSLEEAAKVKSHLKKYKKFKTKN
uniref:Candidate secreted effector n=1 Tax=Meloidogyne incognita TaxID=6306 RepID=A0A914MBH1_MELIC